MYVSQHFGPKHSIAIVVSLSLDPQDLFSNKKNDTKDFNPDIIKYEGLLDLDSTDVYVSPLLCRPNCVPFYIARTTSSSTRIPRYCRIHYIHSLFFFKYSSTSIIFLEHVNLLSTQQQKPYLVSYNTVHMKFVKFH